MSLALTVLSLTLTPGRAVAQEPPPTKPPVIRLSIACAGIACDQDFFRNEITFVDHVRNRQDADVHLLITSDATGPGGRAVTFSFIGQGRFAGQDHVLRHAFLVAESDDAVRREMVRVTSLGLIAYAVDSEASDGLAVTSRPRPGAAGQELFDPWNHWTFQSQLGGTGSGERSNRFSNINASFGGNRTTEAMKIDLSVSGSRAENSFELPDGRRFTAPNRRYGATALLVGSLRPHWSAGVRGSMSSTTFQNLDRGWTLAPALEYDVFPYAESTRRLFTLQYAVGLRSFDYTAETVFGKLSERTAAQALSMALTLRQRWGTVGSGVEATTFLPDVKFNQVSGWGNVDLNLVKGLSLNVSVEVTAVHDQVYLLRGEASVEEILVRQRQLATGYQYFYSFGIRYTFGSIHSSVVNARMLRGGF